MKQALLTLGLIFSFSMNSIAQLDAPKLILPPPDAYSMTKYGDIPVGLFTGTMKYSLPLMQITTGKINLPISLNYSTNGVKVDEVAGHTGMSWSLQASGVITRNIVGKADDSSPLYMPSSTDSSSTSFYNYVKFAGENSSNTQPDEFTYSFGDNSGKFYFNQSGTIREFSPSGNKIEVIGNMAEFKITATDGFEYYFGSGNANEESDSYVPNREVDPMHTIGQGGRTTWWLTRIVSTIGDTIVFRYIPSASEIQYLSSIQETVPFYPGTSANMVIPDFFIYSGDCVGAGTIGTGREHVQAPMESFTTDYNISKVGGLMLHELSFKQGYVRFYYSSREDLPGDSKLDSLILFSRDGNRKINIARLRYVYSQATSFNVPLNLSVLNYPHTTVHFPDNHEYLKKRLFLKEVVQVNPNNYSDTLSYKFDYDNINQLPSRLSFAQDIFGYFNGKSNSGMVPRNTYVHMAFGYFGFGSDRDVDTLFTKKGTLNRITYPTGGFTTIAYENNSIFSSRQKRVHDTLTFVQDGTYTPVYTNTFSTGYAYRFTVDVNWIGEPPVYDPNAPQEDTLMVVRLESTSTGECIVCNGGFDLSIRPGESVVKVLNSAYMNSGGPFRIKFSSTHLNIRAVATIHQYEDINGDNNLLAGGVRVSMIRNFASEGNMVASKRYSYHDPGTSFSSGALINDYQDLRDFFYFKRSRFEHQTFDIIGGNYVLNSSSSMGAFTNDYLSVNYEYVTEHFDSLGTNGSVRYQFMLAPNKLPSTFRCFPTPFPPPTGTGPEPEVEEHSHRLIPGAPYSNTGMLNGREIKRTIFRNVSNTQSRIKEISNYYSVDSRLYNDDEFYVIRKLINRDSYQAGVKYFSDYDINKYKRISAWTHLDSTVTREFDDNNNEIVSRTVHVYDNSDHLQPTQIKNYGSRGEELKTKITYASDVPVPVLVNRNFKSIPLVNESFVNGGLVSTWKSNYGISGSYNIVPLSFQKSTFSNPLETDLIFTKYNANGDPLEFSEKGQLNSLLIDTVYGHLIAGCQNAGADLIAYTSFESGYYGYWTGINPAGIQSQGGVTGNRYFQGSGFNFSRTGLSGNVNYTVSYWSRNGAYNIAGTQSGYPKTLQSIVRSGNTWTLFEHRVSGQTTISVTGSGSIDELRLHPENALMTTYTYIPLVGQSSQCSPGNMISYYEYDGFGRLINIRDRYNNIIKKICYNYSGQVENCSGL